MSKRKVEEATSNESSEIDFVANISDENPLRDYQQLIEQHVQPDEIVPDKVLKAKYKTIAAAARSVIWKLLFDGDSPPADEKLKKAAKLLEEHKCDAGFYSPWEYNEWILNVRDELLKRQMTDFWRDTVVKNELGPCWAKDSDLFDDMDDPEPAAFYAHGGCVAPFLNESNEDSNQYAEQTTESGTDTSPVQLETTDFEAIITEETPLENYQNLMQKYVQNINSDEIRHENYAKIAKAVHAIIWKMLFDGPPAMPAALSKVGKLLEEHKSDACFYAPWDYNKWIVKVRDEILKHDDKLIEFWRDTIVKNELGLCWAKDSDFFDDMDDPEPAAFYAHAGCVAPFATESSQKTSA